jgi:predicted transcriptional regulator
MKLAQPTDFEILEQLADGKRNVASNLAHHLNKDRAYLNTRFPILHDHGLVERIGPAPSSGLYEITSKGQTALQNRDQYDNPEKDFKSILKIDE